MNYFSFQIQKAVFFIFQDIFNNSCKVHNYAMYAVGFIHFNKHDFLHFLEGNRGVGGGGVLECPTSLFSPFFFNS